MAIFLDCNGTPGDRLGKEGGKEIGFAKIFPHTRASRGQLGATKKARKYRDGPMTVD